MRLNKWKSFLCICTSCTLLMSTAASANPAAITPLEESQVSSFQSGNQTSDQGMVSSQGPGSESGSDGAVISSDGPSSSGSPSPSGSPSSSGSRPPQGARPRQEARPPQGVPPRQEPPPRQKAPLYREVRRRIRQPARLQGPLTRRPQLPCRSRR